MPVTASNPSKWRHYPGDLILWCAQWYLRFPISFAHMAKMALERGLLIHSSWIWRWVQIYGPELDQRCRAHLKRTNNGYRVDENVHPDQRAGPISVPSRGFRRPDHRFPAQAKRGAAAAKRFFRKTLLDPANLQPRVINVEKNRTYPVAVEELKVEGTLRRRSRLRQCRYLNNVVAQDHRVSKKRIWLARGYQSFSTAWRTLQGIEAVHMIRKGRARWVGKGAPTVVYRRTVWA